ncbi:hypothetical protein ACSRUE_18335 [Sorangium sp. KYC3313]|uniref:hypothetical protein n=1 Tax=Sorangium sp. KYC3313 TaxID=3449740 RepID=UPI003F8AD994
MVGATAATAVEVTAATAVEVTAATAVEVTARLAPRARQLHAASCSPRRASWLHAYGRLG